MGLIASKEEYKPARNIYAAAQVLDLRRDDYLFANLHAKVKRGIIAAYGDRTAEFTVAYDATSAETLGRMGEIAFLAFASRHRLHFTDHASCLHSQSRRDHIDFTLQSGPMSGQTVDVKTSKWGEYSGLFVGGSTEQFYHQQQHPDIYLFVQIGMDQEHPRARFVGYITATDMLTGDKLCPGGAHGNPQIPVEYLHPVADMVSTH